MPDANPTSIGLDSLLNHGASKWTLDPSGTSIEFHVRHFWGVMTVHGHFDTVSGDGRVAGDGTVSGELRIAAASLNTKNKQRDKHLRSDDFLAAEAHPIVTISAAGMQRAGGTELRGPITLSAAGHQHDVASVAQIASATSESVTLRAEATVDRTAFDMTWSPLHMTRSEARANVIARFVRN